jgi:hypothetical protein
MVPGLHLGRLDHQRDDVWLRNRLALTDRQRPILIGELLEPRLDEGFARHAPHGLEDAAVAHAAASDLNIDHAVAGTGEIQHDETLQPSTLRSSALERDHRRALSRQRAPARRKQKK